MAFVSWPENKYVRHLESRGHNLRQRLQLRSLDPLEPEELIGTYDNIFVLDLSSVLTGSAREVLEADTASWSAMAYREGGGPWLVTSNPWHSLTRRRVSLMEEVAHILLEHKPTALVPDTLTGLPRRQYTPSKEKQAYGVAGAALVPYNGLVPLLHRGESIASIARNYGVSPELVRMRINVTGLHVSAAIDRHR